MAVLNSWQKITRVLPGKPFGDGRDGDLNTATIPSLNRKSCSGTATQSTLNADTDASPYAEGDVILIRQKRGTGVGQWEINMVTAVGSDQYTLKKPLQYTYTDSGASQAQVFKLPMYLNAIVASGTWTIPSWNGNINGDFGMTVRKLLTFVGTINGDAKGFRGGNADTGAGQTGEGSAGASVADQTSQNGSGGGGGAKGVSSPQEGAGGGGGGNAAAGSNGTTISGAAAGSGGAQVGSADLITMTPGGGGGSGGADFQSRVGSGSDGGVAGGDLFIFAGEVTVSSGGVSLDGSAGQNGDSGVSFAGGGGGGSGGNALFVIGSGSLGSTRIAATAGPGGTGNNSNNGGNGSVGRIAVHHSGAVTGTTSPTFTDVEDKTLIEKQPGAGLLMMI